LDGQAVGVQRSDSRAEPSNPGIFNLELGLSRVQPIAERIKLQFRAEMFSSLNNVNFSALQGS
jgi:hypothetical protein